MAAIFAPPRRHIFLFRKRFHAPVVSGDKLQTCRGVRKRPVRPGDLLSLRGWTARPYGSPQFVLRESPCLSVEPIAIRTGRKRVAIEVAGVRLDDEEVWRFVRADGFRDAEDFRRYRLANYPPSSSGILIRWEP